MTVLNTYISDPLAITIKFFNLGEPREVIEILQHHVEPFPARDVRRGRTLLEQNRVCLINRCSFCLTMKVYNYWGHEISVQKTDEYLDI